MKILLRQNNSKKIVMGIYSFVFVLVQYLISVNIYIMGDDYMFGTFGKEGIIYSVFQYWRKGNTGRWLVNIIDSVLCLNRLYFVILLPWLLLLFAWLIYKLASYINLNENIHIFGISLVLVSCIDINMSNSVFYWTTGAMNYLVPAILFLASAIYTIKLKSVDVVYKKKKTIVFGIIICIVSCVTVEQFGLMSLGWMTLVWGGELYKTRKVNKLHIIIFIFSLLSFLSVVLAPAQLLRMGVEAGTGNSLLVKTLDLLYYSYYSRVCSLFIFIMQVYLTVHFILIGKIKLSILSLVNSILLSLFVYGVTGLPGKVIIGITLLSIVLSIIALLNALQEFDDKKNYIKILLFIGIGSQIILLKTDLWGFRTSFSWVTVSIVLLLSILDINENNIKIIICSILIAIEPLLGLTGIIIFLFTRRLFKNTLFLKAIIKHVIYVIIVCFVIGYNYFDEFTGYYNNRSIHEHNAQEVQQVIDGEKKSIILFSYFEKEYGWNDFPLSPFHERYFRKYYDLNDQVRISYSQPNE